MPPSTPSASKAVEAPNLPGNWPNFPEAADEVRELVSQGLKIDPQHHRATPLYARISNDPTESRVGVARQIAMMGKRLIREGTPAAGLWVDNDTSAYDEDKAHLREAWSKIKNDLVDGTFRRLRVHRVDRIFRQPPELEQFYKDIRGNGHRYIIFDNERAYRLWQVQDQNELRSRVHSANSESVLLGQRVHDAKLDARMNGNPPNWHAVLGFSGGRKGDKHIIEAQLSLVVEIFHRLDEGETMTSIAHDFNQRQIPTKSKSPRGWTQAQISRIARNRRYAGLCDVHGEYIDDDGNAEPYSFVVDIPPPSYIPDGFQWPVIDRDLFQRVQDRINSHPWNDGRASNKIYPYSRGALLCGLCGGRMAGGRHSTYQYEIYTCQTGRFHASRGGQHWMQINARYVEEAADPQVRQWLANPWNAGQALYGDQAARGTQAYKAAQEDERRLRHRLDKLELRYDRGTVSRAEYDRRFDELNEELAATLSRIRELEGTGALAYQATWAEVEERWADLEQRRKLIRAATERIEVLSGAEADGADRVLVTLKPDAQPA